MKFLIPSTGCEIELDWIQDRENARDIKFQTGKPLQKPIYSFKYTNKEKPNFTVYMENIERNLNFEVWEKI